VPGMRWTTAFVVGAIISPPDAVAATSVLQRLKVPRRIMTILEGESLVNDATAFVAYKLTVAAVMTGSFSLAAASGRFLWVAAGGLTVGFLVGWLIARVHLHLENFVVETAITLLTPYLAYISAEHLHVSGVLATVAAGGYLGWRNPRLLSALTRFRSKGVWSVLLLLFNGLVFILIGLELSELQHLTRGFKLSTLFGWVAAVSGAAIGVRIIYVLLANIVPRLLSRRLRTHDPLRFRNVFLVGFTGLRGIVSLALALALPMTLQNGEPFPQREIVIALSFGVILVTLVLQGLTLPLVIRLLGVTDEGLDLIEERAGLIRATERALERLDELDRTNILLPSLVERLRAPYAERLERLRAEARDDPECLLTEGEAAAYRRLRDALLAAERQSVVELRNHGEISEEVLHRLQEGIDLEALQPDR